MSDPVIRAEAEQLAASLRLCKSVRRVEIAGSIRRRSRAPRDIELVVEAAWGSDLLGNWTDHAVDSEWVEPVALRRLAYERIKGGGPTARYIQLRSLYQVDLFIAAPDNFGLILAIRTGPADFSRALAARANAVGMHLHDGRLCRGYRAGFHSGRCAGYDPVETPEEDDVFRELLVCWVNPPERSGPGSVRPSGETQEVAHG